jgi:hypothetical protein
MHMETITMNFGGNLVLSNILRLLVAAQVEVLT